MSRKTRNEHLDTVGLESLVFDHIGVATQSLEGSLKYWSTLGYKPNGHEFVDQTQGIKGQFLDGNGPRVEIIEPLDGSKTLDPWLARGIALYHLGFMVDDIEREIDRQRETGAILVQAPVSSVAFGGSSIAFLALNKGWLIELIQAP